VTPESYLTAVKKYLVLTEKHHKQASAELGQGNKHVHRLVNRLNIIKAEIKEMVDGLSGAQ
jgi:hypothetical protein